MKAETPNKPAPVPVNIPDVDIDDEYDPQLCADYVKEIYHNLLDIEKQPCYTIKDGFLEHQREVKEFHRGVLIDWLIQVHRKFQLMQETLYLCMDIIDRYLQVSSQLPTALISSQLPLCSQLLTCANCPCVANY